MNQDFEETLGDGFEERHRKLADQLDAATRGIGLHMEMVRVVPNPEQPDRIMVEASFIIGDVAWSPKVQNPEQHKFDKDFHEIATDVGDDLVEDLRRRAENGDLPWQENDG